MPIIRKHLDAWRCSTVLFTILRIILFFLQAPWECKDEPGVEQFFLGEVGKVDEAEKILSISFFSDGKSVDYSWNDQETTKILKVNDVNAGVLF